MLELIIGQIWPYIVLIITAAGAILGGFAFGRSQGRTQERHRIEQEINQANAQAREKAREADHEHYSTSTHDLRDRARERLQQRSKR